MPTLRFLIPRLYKAIGLSLSREELEELLFRLKCETEWEDNEVYIEVNADRPDMFLAEGIARAVKGLLGVEKGLPKYNVVDSGLELIVEDVPSRPYAALAVVYDVDVDEVFLEELIQFQEKLNETIGRRRRKTAIGFYDLDAIKSKRIIYREVKIDEVRYRPLHGDRVMTLEEILRETEQGRLYGSIALRGGRHPILQTEDGVALSAPPVVNAEDVSVKPGTRHILIDVTGIDWHAVESVLNILAFTLAERSKSKRVGFVHVKGIYEKVAPQWRVSSIEVEHRKVVEWLGVDASREEVADALLRMRHGVELLDDRYRVLIAPYRVDMLSWVDVVEDVAIGLGYERVGARAPPPEKPGSLQPLRLFERAVRSILAGYGFQEVVSFTLASCDKQAEYCAVPKEFLVKLANPVSVELTCLRACIIQQLLELASRNQHIVPLRLFEIGDVVVVDLRYPERTRVEKHVALLLMDERVGYEDVQAIVWGLVRILGDEIKLVKEYEHPLLIPGRAAWIETKAGLEGFLGEVHPEYLEKLGIRYPVALAELRYDKVAEFRTPRP